jgi:hypothetical protein
MSENRVTMGALRQLCRFARFCPQESLSEVTHAEPCRRVITPGRSRERATDFFAPICSQYPMAAKSSSLLKHRRGKTPEQVVKKRGNTEAMLNAQDDPAAVLLQRVSAERVAIDKGQSVGSCHERIKSDNSR